MARDRKCILCETIHASKQEMDEHMRSMLHHRELENLKGRDCGHECRVCKVTVVSLTDYASHISSPSHKQNMDAAEKRPARNDREEDYFDRALVDLIEKRKEKIRREKEAAAAKLAKEEEERKRKEEMQQRLKAQEQYRMQSQQSWHRSNRYNNTRTFEARPWQNSNHGKSATWHAQEPPYFQRWSSGEFASGGYNNQERFGSNQGFWGAFSGHQQSRLPWVSNGGSSNGVYGRNNISQQPQRTRPLSLMDPTSLKYPPLPHLFSKFQKSSTDQGAQQGNGVQNQEGQTPEPDHSSSKSSKSFGSNPKLDKACRWSPYPVSKGSESVPHKDTISSEKFPKVHKPLGQGKAPETSALNRKSRPEQKQKPTSSVEEKVRQETNGKSQARDGSSSSSSRSSSAQREDLQKPASSQKCNKPPQCKDRVMSLTSGSEQSKAPSQVQAQSKLGLSSQTQLVGPLQSRQLLQLPETLRKARQIVLEKRGSLDSSKSNRMEAAQGVMRGQQRDQTQGQVGVNKENRKNSPKLNLQDSVEQEKPELQSSDSSQFLQSLHVSTSTMESSDQSREDVENKKKEEKEKSQTAQDEEAMQAAEAGQSSESDTCRSGDAQTNVAPVSKLHLPNVLKRDLTKHISTKNKAGSHEPNLNIARRVRNLSESRRSDTEKESGLKPTVRQLISSSGSRRNVNWDQVYQEVRKKQDKGKGMPRFGIEMVPFEQEDQSQEEEDIPLLEGFQWDSLIDASAPSTSRKRSLSESSIAPVSSHSLFTALVSAEIAQRDTLSPEQRGSKEDQRQKDVELMLEQFEAKEQQQKQPEKLMSTTMNALQRSDSIVLGESSSGTEMCDSQGTGKRRRSRGDAPSAETSCLEHNSKRRKVKSKKERLQIDQLLAVSLREDELSRSLQTVDTSLIQARAALEAAYLEVQRLMVVKQQMTGEMSTLRNKRIELLKGMQGSLEEAPQVKLKEERIDSIEVDHLFSPVPFSPATDTPAAAPPSPGPDPPADPASPPTSNLPITLDVVIKQEPLSPVHVSPRPDPVDIMTPCPHSTTPELPPDPSFHLHPSSERELQMQQIKKEPQCESFNEPADCKDGSPGPLETMERSMQTARSCLLPLADSKSHIKLLPCSRRSSEAGSIVEVAANHMFEVPSALNSPSELRSGKRVRKLKKRKVLKKAQGAEQPESSDTELDSETLRPRWPCRPRRRPSGSSQVSTSTQPPEDKEGDVNMEEGEQEMASLFTTIKVEPKSPKQRVELPPAELTVTLDSEENMEVSADCPQPHIKEEQTQDSEPQSLACNHVSSTSDMDLCKSSDSEMPFAITLPKKIKTSSDASSDHGEDDLPTEGLFEGHQEAVNAMQIHKGLLYTCSGDRTVKAFDLVSHKCVGVFVGHTSKVSCLLVSAAPSLHHRLYSGSSDQTIRCYSLKTRELEQQFSLSDRVLCLHSRWKILYAGLANGTVVTFNLKTNKQMDVFECHGPRAVSCLASSQEGARSILLVGSYDSTISVRDAKSGLLLRTLEGHAKTVLCMKVVNDLVFSGSSDQCVNAHNIHTGELVRVYKGHSHAVPVVAVLGKVMVTACLDKLVRVFDLQSHEQLQVYGGHKDMVMCMAIHKNMIYTGCYDGSLQAVKLNLMQNYRCWWHGCSLVFGLMEHLQQHLVLDHSSTTAQTLKCRWKNCEEFFSSRNSSKQGLQVHMQKHAEEEIDVEP